MFGTVAQVGGVAVGLGVGVGVGDGVGAGVEVGFGVGFGVAPEVGVGFAVGDAVGRGVDDGPSARIGRAVGRVVETVPRGAAVGSVWTEDGSAGVAVVREPAASVGPDDADASGGTIATRGVAIAASTPPVGFKPPPRFMARTAIAATRSAAASDGRRRGRGSAMAATRARGAAAPAIGAAYTKAQNGQSVAASAQHVRQAYRSHSEQ